MRDILMRKRVVGLLGALALAACPAETDTDTGDTDTGDTDTGDTDTDTGDTDTDTGDTDTGLPGPDERPSNPDCVAFERPRASGGVRLELAYPDVRIGRITTLVPDPITAGWLAISQGGRLWRWDDDETAAAELVLDIRGRVDDGPNEGGLLGLALHPDVADNGEVYLSYTTRVDGRFTSRISRFRTADGLSSVEADSEELLLELTQPYGNHNGGHIAFGPDGFLYVAFGDGGSGGDPLGSGQDTSTLLGSLLRIDVDGEAPYEIPPDNPFVEGGGRAEIYAWGLRNPWSFAFDPDAGTLWAGDVGQNALEEIDIIERGGNYGWNIKEGTACYAEDPCEGGFIDPVAEYGRSLGRSVTGGVVVRGGALPGLEGSYLYADFATGRLWGIVYDPDTGEPGSRLLIDGVGMNVATFGQGPDGDVLLPDYGAGALYRLVPVDGETVEAPATLSATGCTDPDDVALPAPGLVPFEPAHPFWSDGAVKQRWMGLPDGTHATVNDEGRLVLPAGTVLRKDFTRGGERFSTRLMVHHDEGWSGYVYRWRDDGSDADLVDDVLDEAGGGPWLFPGQAACVQCHTQASERALGLEVAQLAHPLDYGDGRPVDQREVLTRIGLVEGLDPDVAPLAGREDPDTALAARAWLHTNCASCHRPDTGAGPMDLRVGTPLAETGVCGVEARRGTVGLPEDARLVVPGRADRSVVVARIRDLGAWRMPPVGSLQVDEAGVALVEAWIDALEGCD